MNLKRQLAVKVNNKTSVWSREHVWLYYHNVFYETSRLIFDHFLIWRYFTSASYSSLNPVQVQAQQTLITSSGQSIAGMVPNTVVLKLYMSSTEYQHIHNYSQSGLQFVAELGGLMSFFFGISVISVLECLLFLCCGGLKRSETDDEEELRKRQPYIARPSIA